MPLPHGLSLPALLQSVRGILPEGLQQSITGGSLLLFGNHQAFVRQTGEQIEDFERMKDAG